MVPYALNRAAAILAAAVLVAALIAALVLIALAAAIAATATTTTVTTPMMRLEKVIQLVSGEAERGQSFGAKHGQGAKVVGMRVGVDDRVGSPCAYCDPVHGQDRQRGVLERCVRHCPFECMLRLS